MEKKGWKILAVILIVILVLENLFIFWGWYLIEQEERKTMECYYDFCREYADADYDAEYGVCYCYEYDVMGNLVVGDSKYMK